MADIVERLRKRNFPFGALAVIDEAADEIERLRAALEEIKRKGMTTGYGRNALARVAAAALTNGKPSEGKP